MNKAAYKERMSLLGQLKHRNSGIDEEFDTLAHTAFARIHDHIREP